MANIDVLDRRRATVASMDAWFERRSNRSDQTIIVDQAWNMHRICSRVRELGPVGILRLLGHGDVSYLELGTGLSAPGDTTAFQMLRGSWVGRFPRLEVHGCGVASSTPVECRLELRGYSYRGYSVRVPAVYCTRGTYVRDSASSRMLQALADNAGVLVIASTDVQGAGVGFEGTVVHFRPAVSYAARDLIGR